MLIGLSGFRGSGKDTVGAYLVENYGFERLSFADKLKQSAAALFMVDPGLWDKLKNDSDAYVALSFTYTVGEETKRTARTMTVREFLQRYGTESHRNIFGYDFWIDQCIGFYRPTEHKDKRYVVTDARFDNELKEIRFKGGKTIRIIRGDSIDDGHISEAIPPADLIDLFVPNTGTIEQLHKAVDWAMQEELGISPISPSDSKLRLVSQARWDEINNLDRGLTSPTPE
jgi:hypothetical protein